MRDSEIYLKAAELCCEPDEFGDFPFACNAVSAVCRNLELDSGQRKTAFAEIMGPGHRDEVSAWFGLDTASNSNVRCVSLCFMAAIAKSEGR